MCCSARHRDVCEWWFPCLFVWLRRTVALASTHTSTYSHIHTGSSCEMGASPSTASAPEGNIVAFAHQHHCCVYHLSNTSSPTLVRSVSLAPASIINRVALMPGASLVALASQDSVWVIVLGGYSHSVLSPCRCSMCICLMLLDKTRLHRYPAHTRDQYGVLSSSAMRW